MLRRSFLLVLLMLPGCALLGPGDSGDLARPIRMLSKAVGGLDDTRARLPADRQPEVARVVAQLRLTLDQIERVTGALQDRAPADLPDRVDALTASTDRLRHAAGASRVERLRPLINDVAARADAISRALRAAVEGARPALRPRGPGEDRLAGSIPTDSSITAVRVAGVVYALVTIRGLAGALYSSDPTTRNRRGVSTATYIALFALGLGSATLGARPIAALVSPEISLPSGEQACRIATSRGEQLADLLRPAAELERQGGAGTREPSRAGALTRAEFLGLVRGGNQRRLLDRASTIAQAARVPATPGPPSAQQIASEVLAKEVRELAAECASFAATPVEVEEARFHHALATEYLGGPISHTDVGLLIRPRAGSDVDPASSRSDVPPGG